MLPNVLPNDLNAIAKREPVIRIGHDGRVAPKRQLYGQPYMRTDPIKTGYIFRIRSNGARWGQSTAYGRGGGFAVRGGGGAVGERIRQAGSPVGIPGPEAADF